MRSLLFLVILSGCYLGDPDPYEVNSLFVNCDVFQQDTIAEMLVLESVRICADIDTSITDIWVDGDQLNPVWIRECSLGLEFQVFGTGQHEVIAVTESCNDTLVVIGRNQ